MRRAMVAAEVGDDIYGEDPTVNRLQALVAALMGKEAALFVPSGTMANQISIRVQTSPGDEVICDAQAHIIDYEAGAMPILSGVQPRLINSTRGAITADQIRDAVRPSVYLYPRTRLLALENTHNMAGGTVFPLEEIKRIAALARKQKLALHLDGARLWNACIATGIAPAVYARYFDSVSVCLSKGLGAPVGSLVVASQALIDEARRVRKQLGGGMRQVGILAAAGIYALQHNLERLEEDHANAKFLAEQLASMDEVEIDLESVQTNIVIFSLKTARTATGVCAALEEAGVLLSPTGPKTLRAVAHLDVRRTDMVNAAMVIKKVVSQ